MSNGARNGNPKETRINLAPIRRRNNRLYWITSIVTAFIASWLGMQASLASPLILWQPPSCELTSSRTNPQEGEIKGGQISFINPSRTSLGVTCKTEQKVLKVTDTKLTAQLNNISPGDIVNLSYKEGDATRVDSVAMQATHDERLLALGSMALLLFSSSGVALWRARGNVLALRELFVGSDRRLSNSKSQAVLWFFILLTSYLGLTYLRVAKGGFDFVGGISIPSNLLLLSGFSAFTYVGSKAITQAQVNRDPNSKPAAAEGTASLADYVTDDEGNTDFGDFQMSAITLLAGTIFFLQIFNYMGTVYLSRNIEMPDVDPTILSLFGLSQGGYLAKKAAQATGGKDPKASKRPGTPDNVLVAGNSPQREAGVPDVIQVDGRRQSG
jgi:hypothetical protein